MIPASAQAEIDVLDTAGLNPGMSDLRRITALAVRETAREIADFSERYNSGTSLGAVIRAKYGVTK